ncbi:MAG: hypothetical protein WDN03_16285 [Rhizomicrobium sp.]
MAVPAFFCRPMPMAVWQRARRLRPRTSFWPWPSGGSYFFPNSISIAGTSSTVGAGIYSINAAVTVSLPSGTATTLSGPAQLAQSDFFGGGVTLSAQNGIFAQGANGSFDAGTAALAVHTPYIGDNAVALASGVDATIPGLVLASAGAVTIDNAGVAAQPTITGIPGASVAIRGQSISISGAIINATAGTVDITSATGITLANARPSRHPVTSRRSAIPPIRCRRMRRGESSR